MRQESESPSQRRDRPPTSHDVARRAGVSQSAVSRVLRGAAEGKISVENQEAILKAIDELGYRPSSPARTLRGAAPSLIGLVIPDVGDAYFSKVLRGAQREAVIAGFSIMMIEGSVERDWLTTTVGALAGKSVAGVIVCAPMGTEELSNGYPFAGPIILVDSPPVNGIPTIELDVKGGMREVAEHLRHLGHRRIGRIRVGVASSTFEQREIGFRSGCSGNQSIVSEVVQEYSLQSAREAARQLLVTDDRPTAIAADTDLLATGAYLAARDLGLEIPTDVSITGFDDIDMVSALDPPLTTVRAPGEESGRLAMRWMMSALDNPDPKPRTKKLGVELVLRSSTAPPPNGPQ